MGVDVAVKLSNLSSTASTYVSAVSAIAVGMRSFSRGSEASTQRVFPVRLASLLLATALGGCSTKAAPAIILFGAYFPAWLIFAILTVLFAIIARIVFGMAGRADAIPFPLFTCLAIGIIVAGVIDLLWLDR